MYLRFSLVVYVGDPLVYVGVARDLSKFINSTRMND